MKVKDTLDILIKEPSNLALAFYKINIFVYLRGKAGKDRTITELLKSIGDKNSKVKDIGKKDYLECLIKSIELKGVNDVLERLNKLPERFKDKYDVKAVRAKVGYRFVSGMGHPSPVENGFLLHHTYGVPYISGESIKGLVRYMYIYRHFELEEDSSEEKLKEVKEYIKKIEAGKYKENELQEREKLFIMLFGTQKDEGKVIFFDAYPEFFNNKNLSVDVMNNHYGEYYSEKGKKPPADWYNPNPVFFLTLKDVTFIFHIGVEKHIEDGEDLLNEASKLLKEGLELFGLGAKRRKGYGWFEVLG